MFTCFLIKNHNCVLYKSTLGISESDFSMKLPHQWYWRNVFLWFLNDFLKVGRSGGRTGSSWEPHGNPTGPHGPPWAPTAPHGHPRSDGRTDGRHKFIEWLPGPANVRPSDRPSVRPWVAVGAVGAVELPSVRPTVRRSKNHSKTMKKHFSSIIDEVISSRQRFLIYSELIYIEKPLFLIK